MGARDQKELYRGVVIVSRPTRHRGVTMYEAAVHHRSSGAVMGITYGRNRAEARLRAMFRADELLEERVGPCRCTGGTCRCGERITTTTRAIPPSYWERAGAPRTR